MTVDPIKTSKLRNTSTRVLVPVPFHSFRAMPHSVLKIMMLAMCRVQLEKPYLPICVSPMV